MHLGKITRYTVEGLSDLHLPPTGTGLVNEVVVRDSRIAFLVELGTRADPSILGLQGLLGLDGFLLV